MRKKAYYFLDLRLSIVCSAYYYYLSLNFAILLFFPSIHPILGGGAGGGRDSGGGRGSGVGTGRWCQLQYLC